MAKLGHGQRNTHWNSIRVFFLKNKMNDYEFVVLHHHKKVLRRELEEAIFLDWAQSRGVMKLGKRMFRINRNVLNSKFEHWRPRPVFTVGR